MKLITQRRQIRELPDVLRQAWQRPNGWKRIAQKEPDTEKIHAAVSALNLDTATKIDVDAAMGFDSSGWLSRPVCHECGRDAGVVVELGEEPDYESATASICARCLRNALDLIEQEHS